MPIITHEDQIELSNLEGNLAKQLNGLSATIKGLARKEDKLGDAYQAYQKELEEHNRLQRDIVKQMETLSREKDSHIAAGDLNVVKGHIQAVTDRIKKIDGFYNRLKDLALQKDTLVTAMRDYASSIRDRAIVKKDIVKIALRIEKAKSKMVAADSISKDEDRLREKDREFERAKSEMKKKEDSLKNEKAEVNKQWQALKGSIDNFQ